MNIELDYGLMQEAIDNYTINELVKHLDMDIASIENYKTGSVPLMNMRLKNAIELMTLAKTKGVTPVTVLSEEAYHQKASQLTCLEECYVFLNQFVYEWSSTAEALLKFKQSVAKNQAPETSIWLEEIVEADFKK